ncbi:MerR family transcriptional regulator [Streptomyces lavendulocolor]|uniref:MerR family transcriptional regulator n=1 Tax=Streptomyces lavendulocolor TaxID=67316 RepID=UPI003C2B0E29
MNDSVEPGMTTGAVARLLGVSPVTLRSWDRRYGIGPAGRRDGGHRRWRPADIAVLREMCRLTAAGLPPAESARAARERYHPADGGPAAGPAAGPERHGDGDGGGGPERHGVAEGGPVAGHQRDGDGVPGAAGARHGVADGGTVAGPERDCDPAGASGAGRERKGARVGAAAGGDGTRPEPPAGGGVPRPRSASPADGVTAADVRRECRGLARAAVRLDAPAVDESLTALVARYGPVVAWEKVMVPVLHAVGRTWETSGDRYVEVEHLLSWHVSTALRRVAPPPARAPVGEASPGPVLLACVPDEQHSLALEALAAGLGRSGVPYRMLGAAVPVEALGAAVRRTGPAAVVLWSQARSTANLPLARDVAATGWGVRGARNAPAVLTAGPGWAGPRPAGVLRPLSLREALSALAGVCGLSPDPAPA